MPSRQMTFEQGIDEITKDFYAMLDNAERLFGERDKSWTYIGLEFKTDEPYIMYYPNKRISIVLSTGCSSSFVQLYYQLAHETCHLLYPTGKKDANILNEGISTYFSKLFQEYKYPTLTYAIDNIKKSRYYESYQLVDELLKADSDIILKLRQIRPSISYATKDDFDKINPSLREGLVDRLIQKFD